MISDAFWGKNVLYKYMNIDCIYQLQADAELNSTCIHIDDKLKWNIHIDKIKSHISSSLFAINKIKHFAPKGIMKTLYYSMVFPYLIYGITLWGATYKSCVNKLTVMQKK